jgi:hypothetical protein
MVAAIVSRTKSLWEASAVAIRKPEFFFSDDF